jgi:flavorubredoxin
VLKTLERISKLGIELKMIAPDHGPVWRKNIKRALELYKQWAEQKPMKKAVVVYDTMWQSTGKMAKAVSDGLTTAGISNKVMKLREDSRSDVATELLEAGALVVGSPTLNNNIFPTLADMLTYVKGLRFKNKIAAVFGSYGWSGEATRQLREMLEAMKMPVLGEVQGKYVPNAEVLDQCFALGGQVAEKLKEICRNGGAA